jgi:aspartate racemase
MTMKTVGLWGGTTWHSTLEYYRQFNEGIAARLGPQHSGRMIIHSVDFDDVATPARTDDFPAVIALGQRVVRSLEAAGADCVMFGANTLHRFATEILQATKLPFVDIVECTVDAIRDRGIGTVALLGTRLTMQDDFFTGRLERAGIRALVPEGVLVDTLHRIIVEELSAGRFTDEHRNAFGAAVDELVGRGAEGVILGCTELPILFEGASLPVPAFDTLRLHVLEAVDFALG